MCLKEWECHHHTLSISGEEVCQSAGLRGTEKECHWVKEKPARGYRPELSGETTAWGRT